MLELVRDAGFQQLVADAGQRVRRQAVGDVPGQRIGGLPEHVEHDRTGLLVPPDDPGPWAAAIARLHEDGASVDLGSAALESWRTRFSPDVALARLEEVYGEAIDLVS